MSKRSKLAILILIALLLLLLGQYLILSPFLEGRQATTGGEYTVPGTTSQAGDRPAAPSQPTATCLAVVGSATGTPIRELTDAERLRSLEYRARVAVERVGSGSSQSGFLGYSDLAIDSTESFKAELKRLQDEMRSAHPMTGPTYGVSTRAASSQIRDGLFGADVLTSEVQAIQTYDAGNPRQPTGTAAKRVFVVFAKQPDGAYLIDSMKWEDMEL
jgi:hypothetical protein